jgi:hypothetical protein
MNIEIIKGNDNPVSEFFSSPSNTPEIDEVEKYSGVTIKDSVTTCGDESSSVYIPVIFARQLERERDKARKDAAQLADRLSGLELRTTEELARMERERNASRELAIAFHNDQTNLILLLQEWKDMAAKLVNIASYALGEFDVKLTLDQQRNITETMREYHSLLKKQ